MKVFGIGLNKTATKSLGRALKTLGYENHLTWNWELTESWSKNNIEPIISAAKENNNFEDWPWPLVYKEMYQEFENAKFVLTIRKSPEVWYESLCKHSLNTPTKYRKLIYGTYMPHDFKQKYIDFYENHNKSVIDFFNKNAPEKLLVICFEDGNSWKKLSDFLGKETPKVDFPFLNNSKRQQETTHNTYLIKLIRSFRSIKKFVKTKPIEV